MGETVDDLTEKERETLRLMARGHDAKSLAKELSRSVHTINERLRSARRKLGVTSSREAARLLLEHEGEHPEKPVHEQIGDAAAADPRQPASITQPARQRALWIGGILIMLTATILAALALLGQPGTDREKGDPATPIETVQLETFEEAALEWLTIVDRGDWDASFAAAGRAFRDPNTVTSWREASELARVPLGAVLDRTTLTVAMVGPERGEDSNRQPSATVRFKTRFENREEAFESVTLEQEHGQWKVVGYIID